MSKYFTTALTGLVLLGGSLVVAAPASAAYNSTRDANCTAAGGVYEVGNAANQDRCVFVTVAAPVLLSGATVQGTATTTLGAVYDGETREALRLDEATTDTDVTHGEWAYTTVNGPVIEGSCVTTGKNKAAVTKCQYEQITTGTRTVTTVITTTTPVAEITEQFQDFETVRTDTTPQTSRVVTTTVRRSFTGSHALSNGTPDSSTAAVDTELSPLTEPVTVDSGTHELAPVVSEGKPQVVEGEPTHAVETSDPVVVDMTCKNNKGKGDRTNACPTS
jgi:hypothetical protein